MRYRYEIDDLNVVRIWDLENPNEDNLPFMLQAKWPNGTPWANSAEAASWAEQAILSLVDETADLPGNSPDLPAIQRATTASEENGPAATEEPLP